MQELAAGELELPVEPIDSKAIEPEIRQNSAPKVGTQASEGVASPAVPEVPQSWVVISLPLEEASEEAMPRNLKSLLKPLVGEYSGQTNTQTYPVLIVIKGERFGFLQGVKLPLQCQVQDPDAFVERLREQQIAAEFQPLELDNLRL
jgi:hypothetical protein